MPRRPVTSTRVERVTHERRESTRDLVAVEEPLQILLDHGADHERRDTPLAVTMRTPGDDVDLVTGFLFGEGVIGSAQDLIDVRHCMQSDTPDNVVRARLREHVVVPPQLLARSLTVTSACGVCGERTLDALVKAGCAPLPVQPDSLHPRAIRLALASLERSQAFFRNTGGTHGAALFDREGQLLVHREDVGRHNALDKLIGAQLRSPSPTVGEFVVVSSRASFELVQKTVRAGFSALVAIGAASSLAVDTARHFQLTLVGFAREKRFNLYAESGRIAYEESDDAFIDLGAE
ncbi:MAG: formate dehydrogenase accessory sulfurtransferase FdhD [Polyangiales bacterium]